MNIKLVLIFLVLLTYFQSISSQNLQYDWASNIGGIELDGGIGVSVSKNGNIFVAGWFQDTILVNNSSFVSKGDRDIILLKYSPNGEILWAKQVGSLGVDIAYDVGVDSLGSIIFSGSFSESCAFENTTLVSKGEEDIFVAKYDDLGNLIWAKSFGGQAQDVARALVIDPENNIIITGTFEETASFSDSNVVSFGNRDVFTAKLDNDGNLIWVRTGGSNSSESGRGVSVDQTSNVYSLGYFRETARFEDHSITSFGQSDIYLVKYDSSGRFVWLKQFGGSGYDSAGDIDVDESSNIYFTGYFEGNCTFDDTSIVSSGMTDIFIAKYNSQGENIWLSSSGGSESDYGMGLAFSQNNSIYLVGSFSGLSSFDNLTLESSGGKDIFISKYSTNGSIIEISKAGGLGDDWVTRINGDNAGKYYITGRFEEDINFSNIFLTSNGSTDLFLVKLSNKPTGLKNGIILPKLFSLFQNYPNPFNPTTTISYSIPKRSKVSLKVYDILGEQVAVLVNETQNPGNYKKVFGGSNLASGVYIYKMQAGDFVDVKKFVLLK